MSDVDAASDRITAAIGDAIRAGELGDTTTGMPAGWVLVGTYHDAEGELRTYFLTNNEAKQHETLGLIALGQTVWQAEAQRWALGDEADPD
ncbi:hypothetical protein ACIBJE_02135 [Micromonospora sp. NPDC050187]|uniref:hypothetical protein n=1 Tax=Micromonospora sp. NPDC050187 TaxID=3364277 RepID=UPI0037AD884E